jgi:large subunit ribosomal protein L30
MAETKTKTAAKPATKAAAKPATKTATKPATKVAAEPATKAPAKTATSVKMIRIQYYRSKNSTPAKHKARVKGLGFTRLNQIVERVDTESTRGMVKAIPHLVRIVEN